MQSSMGRTTQKENLIQQIWLCGGTNPHPVKKIKLLKRQQLIVDA